MDKGWFTVACLRVYDNKNAYEKTQEDNRICKYKRPKETPVMAIFFNQKKNFDNRKGVFV